MIATAPLRMNRGLTRAARNLGEIGLTLRERLRRLLGGKQHTHVVICGAPRSGTSMFCNMMAASLRDFDFDYRDETSSVQSIRLVGNHVSKRPLDVLKLPEIIAGNIHRKRIVALALVRDPRDIITSVHENVPGVYFIGYEAACRVWGEHPNYQYAYDHVGLGEVVESIAAAQRMGEIETLVLHYESLVNKPDAVQTMLAERFGWRFDAEFGDFHNRKDRHVFKPELTQPLDKSLVKWDRPLSSAWIQRWRQSEHDARIIEQFSAYPQLFDMLIDLGYESDRSWFEPYLERARAFEARAAD